MSEGFVPEEGNCTVYNVGGCFGGSSEELETYDDV